MPRNRIVGHNIITSSSWHREEDFRDDSDSSDSSSTSSDSDVSLSSSNRSVSPARSYHSDNSENSGGSREGNSANSNESNSDNSDIDNQSDSESSRSSVSVQSSNGSNHVDFDNNSNSSRSDESQHHVSDENSTLSFEGAFSSGRGLFDNTHDIYDSDDSESYRPLRLPLPTTPSPSGSDRSYGSARSHSQNSESDNLYGLHSLFGSLRRPPTPDLIGSPQVQVVSENETDPRVMTGSSTGRSSTRASTISYECSVCLENLDTPASIDHPTNHDSNNGAQGNETVGTSRGNNRGRGAGVSGRSTSGPIISPTDVVATHCGHLYHQICLEKWFREQGKRTCPSCRKSVPKSKQIRLYPNISVETGPRIENGTSPSMNNPGPSSGNVAGSEIRETVSDSEPQRATTSGNNGTECNRVDCQDLRVIHNTLINDYNELQERFNDVRENDEFKEAQIRSLVEDNARQFDEIARLKRQVNDAGSSPVIASASKRRRQ